MTSTMTSTNGNLPLEVAEFDSFVERSGGCQNGWDDFDHQAFLRIRQRYNAKPVFIEAALPSIPGRTILDIEQHEKWYLEYLRLLAAKKDSIALWKKNKSKVKWDSRETTAPLVKDTEEAVRKRDEERRKIESERNEKAKRLSAWKVKKELDKLIVEEEQMKEMDKKKKDEEINWKRKMEVKRQVDDYKEFKREERQRLDYVEFVRKTTEQEVRAVEAAALLPMFQARDMEKVSQKKEKEFHRLEEDLRREERLEKLRSQVTIVSQRDPSRLVKSTEAHRARVTTPRDAASAMRPPNVVQHRAVPSWRSAVT